MSNEKLERAKRLRDLLDLDPDYTQADLSRHCEVSSSAVAQWVKKGIFNYENAIKIASYFDVRSEWLFYGTGKKRPDPLEAYAMGVSTEDFKAPQEYRRVGNEWEETRNVPVAFNSKYLATFDVNPDLCRLIQVRGNQMAPGIQKGDFVMFAEDDAPIINGEIYVVTIDDRLEVCRLMLLKDGLVVSYDDTSYPSENYGYEADRDRVKVLGPIIALARFA